MPDSGNDPRENPSETWRIPGRAHAVAGFLIAGVACGSLRYFYSQGYSNLYGDGLAHMEGARRIFDSLTPGYEEIGSVWLPLYHLICAPLAQNDFLWRTGLAGGIVSSVAFALAAYVLFRLAAELNENVPAGLAALAGVLLCPSLLYLATTPLTEPLALLWIVLLVYALFRYSQSNSWGTLLGASFAALAGTLTRYEGWNLLPFAAILIFFIGSRPWRERLLRAAVFVVIAGAGPLFWLIHNARRYGNPLEFYNGRGSAEDIYAHQLATTAFPYPTDGHWVLSARYYVEDLRVVVGMGPVVLAALGIVAWLALLRSSRRGLVAILFLLPLPFYIQAMAHAAVPLYVPTLFPYGHYNLRYGIEMMAGIALFPSFVISGRLNPLLRLTLLVGFVAVLGFQAHRMLRNGSSGLPVIVEGIRNSPCRARRQKAIIEFLRGHYDGGRVLMASGKWPCVLPETGLYFRDTLSDMNRTYWLEMPRTPEKYVDWIIRGDGDTVDELMRTHPPSFQRFRLVDEGMFPGEGGFEIYRRQR